MSENENSQPMGKVKCRHNSNSLMKKNFQLNENVRDTDLLSTKTKDTHKAVNKTHKTENNQPSERVASTSNQNPKVHENQQMSAKFQTNEKSRKAKFQCNDEVQDSNQQIEKVRDSYHLDGNFQPNIDIRDNSRFNAKVDDKYDKKSMKENFQNYPKFEHHEHNEHVKYNCKPSAQVDYFQ